MTGNSLRLVKKKAPITRQFVFTTVCWMYVVFCLLISITCLLIAIPESMAFHTFGNVIFSTLLLGVLVHFFSTYLILSPAILRTIKLMRDHEFYRAEKILTRSLNLVRSARLRRDWTYCTAVSNLAVLKVATGQFAEAELMYDELTRYMAKDKKLAKSRLAAIYLNNLAYAHLRQDEFEEAEICALKAKDIWVHLSENQRSGAAFPLVNLAEIDVSRNNLHAAETKLDQALTAMESNKRPVELMEESFTTLKLIAYLLKSYVYLKTDRKANADALTRIVLEHVVADANYVGYSINSIARLASAYLEVGDKVFAETLLEHAYDCARTFPTHPDNALVLAAYEKLLIESNREGELADLRSWVRPVLLNGEI